MYNGQMCARAETENRLHNSGAAQLWGDRLSGELPDTHVLRTLGRAIAKAWRWIRRSLRRAG